ncbi:septum formation protein Maf [Sneathiella chungangensis]|uniref:Nucleoside triphosphate pyrophosphatase n=1 Tax=Sneathiella chungangensis TaxID=1418234 RepID=A0A845MKH6_9PROT|nr:Maf family protein [Sneathiella chungangensis]MZR24062.1 septum formation protein Maf [Sneathiella chungangensis]
MPEEKVLVLASQSPSRARLLARAGLVFDIQPARVDEEEVKHAMRGAGAAARDTAVALAELKASRVSRLLPSAFVIGADQILECGDLWFDKPADMDHARAHLLSLKGRTHRLANAVSVAKGGAVLWRYVDEARLTMRNFDEAFLDNYLALAGEDILTSVGAYQLEGPGAHLFARIEGDFFSILGLPLLPLLDFLRGHKIGIAA